MTERTVAVGLQAKVAGFIAGFRTAGKTVADFNGKLLAGTQKNRAAINDLSTTAGLLGTAMVAASGLAVKSFADFDQAMSNVRAATHESASNMELLRDAALEAGARTAFSATEAAGAIENLAKAGVSTQDILAGGLDGALDLAAAGGLEVADAAEIAATALTQFRLSGEDIPHVADLLAAAAGKAQGEVSDMSFALRQSGLVASQMGLSLEETVGTLAAFASAGLIGSDAGTSFRTMLLRLTNPSEEAADLMERLGINVYDASGAFVGIAPLAEQLRQRLGSLSEEQRNAALATIFGSDAIRAANVLYQQGGQGITDWTNRVNDAGFAAETAAIRMDNLRGDLEEFFGALETALIGAGEGANGPLRSLVQRATEAVNAFNDLPPAVQQSTLAIVGGGGLVLLGVAGMARLIIGISDARKAMQDLGISAGRVGRILRGGLVLGAIFAVGQAVDILADKVHGLDISLDDLQRGFREWNRQGKVSGELARLVGEDFEKLGKSAELVFHPSLKKRVDDFATSLIGADSEIDKARERFERLDQTLASMDPDLAAKAFRQISDVLRDQGFTVQQINQLFPRYRDSVQTAAEETKKAESAARGAAGATKRYGDASADAALDVDELEKQAEELLDALNAVSDINLEVVNTEIRFRNSLRDLTDAVDENGRSLQVGTRAGDANIEMLNRSIAAAKDSADAVFEKTKRDKGAEAAGRAWSRTMARNIGDLLKEADQLGFNEQQTRRYIARILGVPERVLTRFDARNLARVLEQTHDLRREADNLDGRVVSTRFVAIQIHRRVHDNPTGNLAHGGLVGEVRGMPAGGLVTGPGGPTEDRAGLFALSDGEFVVNARATRRNLPLLRAINAGLVAGTPQRSTGTQINVEHLEVKAFSDRFNLRQVQDELALRGVA